MLIFHFDKALSLLTHALVESIEFLPAFLLMKQLPYTETLHREQALECTKNGTILKSNFFQV